MNFLSELKRGDSIDSQSSISKLAKQRQAVQEKRLFVEYDLEEYLFKNSSPVDEMRQLDLLHMHNPTPDEGRLLNVPDERLNLCSLGAVLNLCGGMVGVRFTSEDLCTLRELSQKMTSTWTNLEKAFSALDKTSKKNISRSFSLSRDPQDYQGPGMDLIPEDKDGDGDGLGDGLGVGLGLGSETKSALESFHSYTDLYMEAVSRLQDIVQTKQASIDIHAEKLEKSGR